MNIDETIDLRRRKREPDSDAGDPRRSPESRFRPDGRLERGSVGQETSSHRWLTGVLGQRVGPLCSTRMVLEHSEFLQCRGQFLDGPEVPDPEQLLLERPEEAFDTSIAFPLAPKVLHAIHGRKSYRFLAPG